VVRECEVRVARCGVAAIAPTAAAVLVLVLVLVLTSVRPQIRTYAHTWAQFPLRYSPFAGLMQGRRPNME
jgi:hypothetical protein